MKQKKECPHTGWEVLITLLYQMEGTKTCQVACTPLSWRCSAESRCGGKAACSLFRDYLKGDAPP